MSNSGSYRLPLVAAGSLLLGGVLGGFAVQKGSAATATPAVNGEAVASAPPNDQELKALRKEVQLLRAQLVQALAAGSDAPARDAVEQAKVQTSGAGPTEEEEAEWLAARATFYDRELKKQRRNDAWATPLEAIAKASAARHAALGVKLVDAECWSTACRMEFSYPNAEARLAHLDTIPRDFRELPRASYAYPGAPQDNTRVVLYMTPKTESLPEFVHSPAR